MYGKDFNQLNTKYNPEKKNGYSKIFFEKNYSLYKLILKKNKFYKICNSDFFIYNTNGFTFKNNEPHKSEIFKSFKPIIIKAIKNSFCYVMFQRKSELKIKKEKKFLKNPKVIYKKILKLNKYWGDISTLYSNKKGAAKIINMKKGTQSSMEFHINKIESYFISKGFIELGIRYGRAKQKIINLKKNSSFFMKPGTMHMRMAAEDSQIVELSNKDSDNDSIIVHDGLKYKFKELR